MNIPKPLARLFVSMYTVMQMAQPLTALEKTSDEKSIESKRLSDILNEAKQKGHNAVIVKTGKSYYQLALEGYFTPSPDTTYNTEVIVVAKLLEELNIKNEGDSLGGKKINLLKPSKDQYKVLLPVNFKDFGLEYSPLKRPFKYKAYMRPN